MMLLSAALTSSWQATAACALVQGVVVHLLVRPYEIDSFGWQIVFSYLGLLAWLFSGYVYVGFSFVGALGRIWLVSAAFNTGIFSSILLYRAFFHRLHRFPGPYLAKLSRFYFTRLAVKRLQAMYDVQELHAKYGDFVRIGPRELSINRPSAIKAIYGPPMRCMKSPWYGQVSDDVTKISLNSTRDLEVHKNRKKAWERGLSFRALATYESRVAEKTVVLMETIEKKRSEPLDMATYSMFYGFDVMGYVGLSKDFGMLRTGKTHAAIQGLHDTMIAIGTLGTVPWLLCMLGKIPGSAGPYLKYTEWCHQQLKEKRAAVHREKAMLKDQDPQDIMSWLIRAEDEHDRSAPPGEGAIQEDARLLIIAGSDTSSMCLVNTLYYLILNPGVYKKLQQLVNETFPSGEKEWSYETVKNIPYIDQILQESLRLRPPVPGGLQRMTPPEGIQVDEEFIPGNSIVSVPTWTIQRDGRYWDQPLEFMPERWETMTTDQAPWIPFSRGQNLCPGRNLFYMELRMVLSRLAMRYDLSFAPGYDYRQFELNTKDTFTLMDPELPVMFTPVLK